MSRVEAPLLKVMNRNVAFESPAWHEEVLADRDRQIASGEARYVDWEQAKDQIRKRIS